MATLRILGLDNDNHSPMWVCEDGTVFNTAKEFMEFLNPTMFSAKSRCSLS